MISVHWDAFTPYQSLAGGVLIGISAFMLLALNGRIAGISGILGGLLKPKPGDVMWRLAFTLGLLVSPWLYQALAGPFEFESPRSPIVLLAAGLLVGYGTRLGSGCTSGHGVCGLSRLSLRSLLATGAFMLVGMFTASVLMHLV